MSGRGSSCRRRSVPDALFDELLAGARTEEEIVDGCRVLAQPAEAAG
jgi:hypothetical protein